MKQKKETSKTYIKGIEVVCNATVANGKVVDIEVATRELKNR